MVQFLVFPYIIAVNVLVVETCEMILQHCLDKPNHVLLLHTQNTLGIYFHLYFHLISLLIHIILLQKLLWYSPLHHYVLVKSIRCLVSLQQFHACGDFLIVWLFQWSFNFFMSSCSSTAGIPCDKHFQVPIFLDETCLEINQSTSLNDFASKRTTTPQSSD